MPDITRIASLAIAGAVLALLPNQASGQGGATPKPAALCLPAGATTPVACGSARAGQTIRLQVATTSLPTGPISLLFAEAGASGQAARSANVIIPPARSRDGGYEVTVPRELCSRRPRPHGQFRDPAFDEHVQPVGNDSALAGDDHGRLLGRA